jgi:hypothetical protein
MAQNVTQKQGGHFLADSCEGVYQATHGQLEETRLLTWCAIPGLCSLG